MRVALYHHLPPGGALRVVGDFVANAPPDVEIDLFGLEDVTGSPFQQVDYPVPGTFPRTAPLDAGRVGDLWGGRLSRPVLAARLGPAERTVAEMINAGNYDVAYIHPSWLSNVPGLVRLLRAPSVVYLHEVRRASFEPSYRQGGRGGLLGFPGRIVGGLGDRLLAPRDRRGVGAATRLACNSTYTAERILASYGRAASVVPPGVDTNVFRPRTVPASNTPYVLSVGGLEPFKNHHVTVDALAKIDPSIRPSLVLVYERCDAQYRRRLLERAREVGVIVTEQRGVSDEKLAELYSGALATVACAQLEPLGLTPLESIACGTPVVAVREAGYRETVSDGENGLLVPRSVPALSRAISDIVAGTAGIGEPGDIPSTILPFWSVGASTERQVAALREVVDVQDA
ncbi:glycosyltransferase family 4 protein [Phycicoccus duodecadis]|uniref:Glycosyl transferase family 4 n=1 Tax=Phycicoccus duodecadis TaxID=173053 RepID=A0A2N3YK10_9MICO|nr:glycosyltransferase family 4 protein [Phycicoccus duodecadis]PKW27180.1 glycosyl transferase family 4 [Phycicoccus duodecadis]